MNPTSSSTTGTALAVGYSAYPVVDWLMNTVGHCGAPAAVVMAISAGLVTAAHLAINKYNAAQVTK